MEATNSMKKSAARAETAKEETSGLRLVPKSTERKPARRARLADLEELRTQVAAGSALADGLRQDLQHAQGQLDVALRGEQALAVELAALKAPPEVTGFVADVRAAVTPERGLELFIGLLWGGFVPVATFFSVHEALPRLWAGASAPGASYLAWAHFVSVVVVTLGGLLKSSPVVYGAAKEAFGNWAEALGFVLIFEGVMALVPIPWLQAAALVGLVGVNVVGTATRLAQRSRPRR